VLGIDERFDIAQRIEEMGNGNREPVPAVSAAPQIHSFIFCRHRTRSFLKVRTVVIITVHIARSLARGSSRNPEIKTIVEDARKIAEGC